MGPGGGQTERKIIMNGRGRRLQFGNLNHFEITRVCKYGIPVNWGLIYNTKTEGSPASIIITIITFHTSCNLRTFTTTKARVSHTRITMTLI